MADTYEHTSPTGEKVLFVLNQIISLHLDNAHTTVVVHTKPYFLKFGKDVYDPLETALANSVDVSEHVSANGINKVAIVLAKVITMHQSGANTIIRINSPPWTLKFDSSLYGPLKILVDTIGTSGVTHGSLSGLTGTNHHPQYADGTIPWSGDIDVGGNDIVNVGLVDGRDPSADGAVIDGISSHTGDLTIHFTEGSIDHTNISNIGSNSHADIDSHIAASDIHALPSSMNHDDLLNTGATTHANIDLHVNDNSIHSSITLADEENIYHVGKHGSDSNDGRTASDAFLTFGKAMTEVLAQSPSASNRFAVYCHDAGFYTENVVCTDYTDIVAPSVTIQNSSGTSLSIGRESSVRIYGIEHDTTGIPVVRRNTSTTSYLEIDHITMGPTGFMNGIAHLGTTVDSVLQAKVKTITVGNGKGIAVNAAGHLHFDIEDIYLTEDNAIGIERTVAGTSIGRVTHILELGSPSNTKAINVTAGRISARIDTIQADTAWDVGAGGELDLYASSVTGTRTVAGTLRLTEVGLGGPGVDGGSYYDVYTTDGVDGGTY